MIRADLPQTLEKPTLRVLRGRLDIDHQDVLRYPRQQPCFHQRRLAAARWSVDQPDTECSVRVVCFDACLPEPDALRESFSVSWSRKQFQEEVGVVLVEGAEALGDDLDRV
jgi:hypothetical protein